MFARSRPALTGASVLLALLISSCSSSPATTSGSQSASSAASASDAAVLTLAMANSKLGSILVDGRGMTLYMFTKDSRNTSACSGQCLAAWPALKGVPTAGTGVNGSLLGSFKRTDGATQATYNGWPLYYWSGDRAAGDVNGQNVQSVWFVLDHNGNPVKK